MGTPAFIALAATIFNSLWAVFVLSRDFRSTLHRIFFFWTGTVVLWNFGAYRVYRPIDPEGAVFWAKVLQMGVILMPVALFHLCALTAHVSFRKILPLLYAITAVFAATIFTDWFVSGVRYVGVGYWATPGPAFWFFLVHFFVTTLGALVLLVRQRNQKRRLDRIRINSLFIAIAFLWVFGGNDLLPLFGLDFYPGTQIRFYPLGNVSAIFYVMIVAYSVLQHQLLDIHMSLGRLAAHLVRFGFLSLIGLVLLSILAVLRPGDFNVVSLTGGACVVLVSGVLASILFPRLFGSGADSFERRLLGDRFEYHDRVRRFTDSLPTYSDANVLLADLDDLLEGTVRVESYKIILLDEGSRVFSLFRSHPEEEPREFPELNAKSPAFQLFEEKKSKFLDCRRDGSGSDLDSLEAQARRELAQFEADLCFPFFFEDQLFGLLLLGPKAHGEPYTATDINLLVLLNKNLSLVINQIRLRAHVLRQQELDLLGRMSRGLAHDLNNLLTPVWTFAELASSGAALEDIVDDILPVAIRNLRAMRAYIREALFFSENLRLDLQLGRMDLLMAQAVDVVEGKRMIKNIKVEVSAPPDALVEMDEVLIQRLVGNILSNAIDASPAGSTIRVEVSRLIQTDALRDWYRVRVIDEGEGILPEHLSRISTPYFTTKNRGDETRGFGLGLAICRKIVHLHGGNMNIFSQVKLGTTVQVDLPSRPLKPAPAPSPSLTT